MSLRIHVYTICWNESMMLPHFLRYYSGFAEKIFVYDNFSSDSSREICNGFSKVHTNSYFTNNQIRDDLYLQIKNHAWKKSKGEADWVIVCDVDEWVYHPELVNFLKEARKTGTSIFQCVGYNMISQATPGSDTNILEEIKEGVRSESFDKMLVFDPQKIEDINYEFGSHSACPVGEIVWNKQDLKLLHYKYMGLEYMIHRYRQMGERLSKQNRKKKLGYHYLFSAGRIRKEFNQYWKERVKVI